MHVAIIGAGAAGLNAARHCVDHKYGFTCEVFEQTNDLGGTWIYTDQVGIDEHGLPIHTSMYKDLRTNLPKEVMNFPDFKFPPYEESYVTQRQVLEYLLDYVDKHHLKQYIKFHHQVTNVSPIDSDRWIVTVKDLLSEEIVTKEFNAVIVCNGHYSEPDIPDIPGKKSFKGKILHSNSYRDPKHFEGETVVILGAGPSGVDIALHLANSAKKILLSHRHQKITSEKIHFPENIEQVKSIIRITENGCVLADNTIISADSIIFCTGYKYYYPFLSEECKITVDNNWVKLLYKHVINVERPTMALVGLLFRVCPFPIFDYQVRFFLSYLKGTMQLPTKEEMIKDTEIDMNSRWAKGYPKKLAHQMGADYQGKYFDDLTKLANLKPLSPVIIKLFNAVSGKIKRHLRFEIINDNEYIQLNN